MNIQFKTVRPGALLPVRATELAAGADLAALGFMAVPKPGQPWNPSTEDTFDSVLLEKGDRVVAFTGLSVALPEGYEAQVRPRSGLALKQGVTVLNAPGTIDADYRGEILVILVNHGDAVALKAGDRVAQLVVAPVSTWTPVLVQSFSEVSAPARGEAGFGSTGMASLGAVS